MACEPVSCVGAAGPRQSRTWQLSSSVVAEEDDRVHVLI